MSETINKDGQGNEAWKDFNPDQIAADVEQVEFEANEQALANQPSEVSVNGQKLQMPHSDSEGMPVSGGVGPNPDVVGADQAAAREADQVADAGTAEKAV